MNWLNLFYIVYIIKNKIEINDTYNSIVDTVVEQLQ